MKQHKKIVIILSIIVTAMFSYSFALIPLYNAFCKVTGLNGKWELEKSQANLSKIQLHQNNNADGTLSRLVTIEFDVNKNQKVPVEFIPEHTALQIDLAELKQTTYLIKNLSNRKLIIQAIPSISPGYLARYLKKLECFCFDKQVLKPFETQKLALRFWLEPEFPDSIHRLTLSYTLFEVQE